MTTETIPKSVAPGVTLGHFFIEEKIGEGGMGDVYRARDDRLGRQVALKVLSSDLFENATARARFEREAKLAAAIPHANVATVLEVGEEGEVPYIAMELVSGSNLKEVIRASGPMDPGKALSIAIRVCDALEAAHEVGVIHRDVKSSNIMVGPDGRIKVLDFGLAKALLALTQRGFVQEDLTYADISLPDDLSLVPESESTSRTSRTRGVVLGTPSYMSPEQAWGKPLDARSDLFSLGIVLYECMTGQLPFRGQSQLEIIKAVRSEDPFPFTGTPRPIPAAVAEIIARCLDKAPAKRYDSASALRTELIRVQRKLADRKRGWRRPALWAAMATLPLIAGAAIVMDRLATKSELQTIAVLPLLFEGTPHQEDYLAPLVTDALIAGMQAVPQIAVAPYETVASLREASPLPETRAGTLCQELNVARIVYGTLKVEGDILRIEAAMRGRDGTSLWSASFSGQVSQPIPVVEKMKGAILAQVPIQAGTTSATIQRSRTPSLAAYQKYLEARDRYESWDIREDLEAAVSLFREATILDPDFAAAHAATSRALVTLFYETNEPSLMAEARAAAERAMAVAPDLPEALLAKGIMERESGNSVEAEIALRRVIRLTPGYDRAYRALGNFLDDTGQQDAALETFQRAVELRPGSWRSHFSLARFHLYSTGDFDLARQHFTLADERHPLGTGPKHGLGFIYMREGNLDEAERVYRQIQELAPGDATARYNLGWVYFYRRDYELALRAWQAALQATPNMALYHAGVGDAFRAMNQPELARTHLNRAATIYREMLAAYPEDDENRADLSNVLAALGQCDEAFASIEQVLAQHPTSGEFASLGAVSAARCGDLSRASRWAVRAMERGEFVRVDYHPDLETVRKLPIVEQARAQALP